MDSIMEILLTIIFEGALDSITEKNIPWFLRIMTAAVLLLFYVGFGSILIYIGIKNNNGIVIGTAIFLLIIVSVVAAKKYQEIKRKS